MEETKNKKKQKYQQYRNQSKNRGVSAEEKRVCGGNDVWKTQVLRWGERKS